MSCCGDFMWLMIYNLEQEILKKIQIFFRTICRISEGQYLKNGLRSLLNFYQCKRVLIMIFAANDITSEALNFRITDLPNTTIWHSRFFQLHILASHLVFQTNGQIKFTNVILETVIAVTARVVISDKVLFHVTFHICIYLSPRTSIICIFVALPDFALFFITQSKYSLIILLLSVYTQRLCVQDIELLFYICLQMCDFAQFYMRM